VLFQTNHNEIELQKIRYDVILVMLSILHHRKTLPY